MIGGRSAAQRRDREQETSLPEPNGCDYQVLLSVGQRYRVAGPQIAGQDILQHSLERYRLLLITSSARMLAFTFAPDQFMHLYSLTE
jgi:hypothetical protein